MLSMGRGVDRSDAPKFCSRAGAARGDEGATVPEISPAVLESLFGLIVHDLRNPAATLGANISFVREVLDDPSVPPQEVTEALSDAQQALGDLMRGLDQIAWIGRWANDKVPVSPAIADVRAVFEAAKRRIKYGQVEFVTPEPDLRVRGGESIERLIDLLVANGHQHAPQRPVRVRAARERDAVVVEVEDEGRPIGNDVRTLAFSLEGQVGLKGRAEGRYGRVAGLFVASILAQAAGARLDAVERDGKNVFRIRLTPA
jgi:K+-sensing histidine kinase KdpD